jgi:hypothetical protein
VADDIRPIETRYGGYKMRSRIEARWAVFFDASGVKWEYEREGFDLGRDGYYLPDFYLPELGVWVEIKGSVPTIEECHKCERLAEQGEPVFILWGAVGEHKVYVWALTDKSMTGIPDPPFANHQWPDYGYAIGSARSARFEHGAKGANNGQ